MNGNGRTGSGDGVGRSARSADGFAELRRKMVERQIHARGITSPRVLEAMLRVPRHEFVPVECQALAYSDQPLPIGGGQTISQPFMVAAMVEALELKGKERVLEVGAGSGYETVVLSLLAGEVYTVEIHAELAAVAEARLARLGYTNVHVRTGDGSLGWPEAAPFDAIVVTAAAPEVPPPLIEQLAEGGRLVIPIGETDHQELRQLRKIKGRITERLLHHCRFVPLLGRHGWRDVSGE